MQTKIWPSRESRRAFAMIAVNQPLGRAAVYVTAADGDSPVLGMMTSAGCGNPDLYKKAPDRRSPHSLEAPLESRHSGVRHSLPFRAHQPIPLPIARRVQ